MKKLPLAAVAALSLTAAIAPAVNAAQTQARGCHPQTDNCGGGFSGAGD